MLTENEWNTINNMLLELYTIDELDVFTSKILKMIRMLIPYTKGWFIILDDDRKIRKEQSYFIGFDTDVKDNYINRPCTKKKYIYFVLCSVCGIVYIRIHLG